MKAKDIINKPPHVLIYGPIGTQKTSLVSQASNGYMLDFDDGMITARDLKDKFTSLRQNIEFDIFVDEDPSKPKAWLAARKKIQDIITLSQTGKWKYDAIIIDSLTGMAKVIMLHVMSCAGNSYKKPEIQHWGSMVQEMEVALTMLRAIKTLRLTTAHELSLEVAGADCFTPMSITKGHSTQKLMWLFDEVWYANIRKGARGVTSFLVGGKPSGSHRTRTRSGLIEDVNQDELGLKGILSKINYKYGE